MKWLTLLTPVIFLSFTACNNENSDVEKLSGAETQFNSFDIAGNNAIRISQLKIQGNFLYIVAHGSLYRKNLTRSSSVELLWLDTNKTIVGFQVTQNGKFIIAWNSNNTNPSISGFTVSSDQGSSWQIIDTDFGGSSGEKISSFAASPHEPSLLYASGDSVLAKSTDGAKTWEVVWGDWNMNNMGINAIAPHPSKAEEIWMGGQSENGNGYLMKSTDNGATWESWFDLVQNPTGVKSFRFHPSDARALLVGFEGALLQTSDGGQTWETLIQNNEGRFFFGAAYSLYDPSKLYAGGWVFAFENPQPFILYNSQDYGNSWTEIINDVILFGGICSMELLSTENEDILYLGLHRGGLYEVVVPR